MVDGELFLPQEWFGPDFAQRRKELGIPEERTVETKIALGLQMVKRAKVHGLPFELLACDALYGRDSQLRADVDPEGVWYAAQVPADTPVYVSEPQVGVPQQRSTRGRPRTRLQVLSPHPPQEVRILAGSPSTLWHHRHVRQTERGRLAADFAIRQVWTVAAGKMPRAAWLVIRRDAEGDCA
jgi:SRSO17 transposase